MSSAGENNSDGCNY